ncbi:MAG TPA: hypothetical protein VHY30_07705 [Verrucomicrobiae bacterium]|nr:hypothetical protein [Verrucomicrobiae bacterium]
MQTHAFTQKFELTCPRPAGRNLAGGMASQFFPSPDAALGDGTAPQGGKAFG